MMAEETPISSTSLPAKISFGTFFHMKPLSASLLFLVFPCKHLFNNVSSLSSLKMGFTTFLIASGKPGFCTYLSTVPLFIACQHLHHVLISLLQYRYRVSTFFTVQQWKSTAQILFFISRISLVLCLIAMSKNFEGDLCPYRASGQFHLLVCRYQDSSFPISFLNFVNVNPPIFECGQCIHLFRQVSLDMGFQN